MLRTMGRPEEGLALATEGWEALRGSDRLEDVAKAGHDLGNILRDLRRYDEALEVLSRAVEAGDELRDRGDPVGATWGAIGARSAGAMTWAAGGRLHDAIEDQSMAFAIAEADGMKGPQAVTRYHLSRHLLEAGDLDEAASAAEAAFLLSGAIGMPVRAVKCRLVQAEVALARGELPKARAHLEDAEFRARRDGVAIGAWLSAVEALVALLLAQPGGEARAAELVADARRRTSEERDPDIARRLEALVQSVGVGAGSDGLPLGAGRVQP